MNPSREGERKNTSMLMRGAAGWVIACVFAVLAVRLAFFIDQYAINLLYYDEWDYLNGLFEGADAWTLFRWQHGPHRQGLGNLILAVVLDGTGWNSRAVAVASAVAMVLAGLAALVMVKRVCGRLRSWDVIVPLLFVTTTTVDSYAVTPNLAHGPLPALFLTLYALSLTVGSHATRALLITAINFLAVNTGFTLLLGPITPVVLLLLACQPGLHSRARMAYGAACAASIATAWHFAHDLRWAPAVDCFEFPHDPPWLYAPYTGRILTRPLTLPIDAPPGELAAGGVALLAVGFALYAACRALRSRGSSTLWNVTAVLAAFTVVFAVATAVGRVCLGIPTADASRYIPYVLPGLLVGYLVIRCSVPAGRRQSLLLGLFLLACVLKETSPRSRLEAAYDYDLKRAWRDCYLRTHDIATCNATAGRPVYPAPEATRLQQKLDWLEARRYNLFQER